MILRRENGYCVVFPLHGLPFLFSEIRGNIYFVELSPPVGFTIEMSDADDCNNRGKDQLG